MTTAAEASWATRVSTPASASRRTREPTPGGNRSIGRRPRREPPRRVDGRGHQRDHAEGRPARQQVLRQRRQLVQPVAEDVRAADRAERGVGADHDQGRQQRRQRRGAEPPVRLEDPVQHDREPVEEDLRREDDQHPGADAGHHGARAPGGVRKQHRDDRVRGQRERRADRHEQDHGPGQQGRRDPPGRVGGLARPVPLQARPARPTPPRSTRPSPQARSPPPAPQARPPSPQARPPPLARARRARAPRRTRARRRARCRR